MRSRWGVWIGAAVLVLVGLTVVPDARAEPMAPSLADAAGIQVQSVTQPNSDSRQYNVSVRSDALGRAVDVRILVPGDYAER